MKEKYLHRIRINSKRFRSIFRLLIDSIKGKEYDYTQGSLRKAMVLLSVPMVLEMLMESLFSIADIYFVSSLGPGAVSAVGLTESICTLIYALGIGMAVAATAMVSRRIGEKRPLAAANAAYQAIISSFIFSIPIALSGIFFGKELLMIMGADVNTAATNSGFTTITMISAPIIMLLFIINAVFRSSGHPAVALRILFLANGLNIILDPILIFGLGPIPALGIEGAAIATMTGRGIAVVYQLYLLFSGKSGIDMYRKVMIISRKKIMALFKLASGVTGQYLIGTVGWIGLMRIMAGFGAEMLAAYTITIRIILFFLFPASGIANAAATLVGQNLGARAPHRAEYSAKTAAWFNTFFLGSIGLLLVIFSKTVIGFFTDEIIVIEYGAKGLAWVSAGMILYGMGMVMGGVLNAAGDTRTPTIFTIICFWAIELPLAYALGYYTQLGAQAIYISILIAEGLFALLGFWWFSKGYWKKIKV